jgi:hypothetical protein
MKPILTFLTLLLMLGGVASAEIIKLKCIDEMEKHTLEPIIDTKNKTAIVGQTKDTVFIGTSHYSLHGDGSEIYINRYTGGFKRKIGESIVGRGTCYRDPKIKF